MLNKVQKAAFDLIQSDARFIYTLVDMQNNAKNINSNYVMMSIPYIINILYRNHLTALLSRSDQATIFAGSSNQYSFRSGINSYSTMDDKICALAVSGVKPQK